MRRVRFSLEAKFLGSNLLFLVFIICLLVFNHFSIAEIITVGTAGDYQKIQDAIGNAIMGDEIIVSEGIYCENIVFIGQDIILRSNDPNDIEVVENTIIDGNEKGSVVFFMGVESFNCTLSGFTVTGGDEDGGGGGICGNGTLATIKNNIITENHAHGGGGIWDCDGLIENNIVYNNIACYAHLSLPTILLGSGGGLCGCDGSIRENVISENTSMDKGGGFSNCNGTIYSNTITKNTAWNIGGGLYGCDGTIYNNNISENLVWDCGGGFFDCNGAIHNNVISENQADYGGGLGYCDGIIQNNVIADNTDDGLYGCNGIINNNTMYDNSGKVCNRCSGLIINCIIWGESEEQIFRCNPPICCCIQDWDGGGVGNITDNPKLVDPSSGDYHLQSDSPCIDKGNKNYLCGDYIIDIDGEGRIAGSSVDIGCDEFNSSVDSDGDFLIDSQETLQGSNPYNKDTDDDGLIDGLEIIRGLNPNVYDIPPNITIPNDYVSIQEGIFLAFPCEIITVLPNTYRESIHLLGKNVVLQSANPLNEYVVRNTVLDGCGYYSVLHFSGLESGTCIVKGFTIQNGYGDYGGGIFGNGTLAKIENNRIINNSAYWYGGGLYQCNGIVQNNIIYNNSCEGSGGGLHCCRGIIQLNTIWGNSSDDRGGGMAGCDGVIKDCIIWGNSAFEYPQVYAISEPTYCCIQTWISGGTGNININPKFINPENGDFHLRQDSPCIDAGCGIVSVTYDFEGHSRGYNGTPEQRGDGSDYDIGADEYVGVTMDVQNWDLWD